jgi:hypothetical protein
MRRPRLMASPDMPTPPRMRHTSFGPSAGQRSSKFVSDEIPFRSGPRICGHSASPGLLAENNVPLNPVEIVTLNKTSNATREQLDRRRKVTVSIIPCCMDAFQDFGDAATGCGNLSVLFYLVPTKSLRSITDVRSGMTDVLVVPDSARSPATETGMPHGSIRPSVSYCTVIRCKFTLRS